MIIAFGLLIDSARCAFVQTDTVDGKYLSDYHRTTLIHVEKWIV
jgi:hypothetical protein